MARVTFGVKRAGKIVSLKKLQNAAKRKLTAYKRKR